MKFHVLHLGKNCFTSVHDSLEDAILEGNRYAILKKHAKSRKKLDIPIYSVSDDNTEKYIGTFRNGRWVFSSW